MGSVLWEEPSHAWVHSWRVTVSIGVAGGARLGLNVKSASLSVKNVNVSVNHSQFRECDSVSAVLAQAAHHGNGATAL